VPEKTIVRHFDFFAGFPRPGESTFAIPAVTILFGMRIVGVDWLRSYGACAKSNDQDRRPEAEG